MKYQDLYQEGKKASSPEEAIDLYRESLSYYDGDDNLAWVALATELNGVQSYLEALEAASKSIDCNPRYQPSRFMGFFQKALALTGLERYQEALEAYDKAIAYAPGFAEFYLGRMVAKQSLGIPYADDIESAKKYS
jgi:tetratricopeptide (TPR) repeat protein